MTHFIEHLVFSNRKLVVALFAIATVFLGFQASQMRLDAGFEKNIPLNHEYMKTYIEHRQDFGGANNILVSVCDKNDDIFNQNFFDTLKNVHDQLFFINGVLLSILGTMLSPPPPCADIDIYSSANIIRAWREREPPPARQHQKLDFDTSHVSLLSDNVVS